MRITLLQLIIENFKGIKHFEVEFAARTRIKGQNGSGKTTVFDAFLWLRSGKDSDGMSDFSVRPLDEANEPINGLVVSVTAKLEINGAIHLLRKEQRERLVGREIKGFGTKHWIDGVPKKAGEFATFISNLIPEDTFKMLTDLRHFNGNLHWTDRRKVLMDIAGPIGSPGGFDELLAELNNRSMDDMKKMYRDQKTEVKDRLDVVPELINENQMGLSEYAGDSDLESRRETVMQERQDIEDERGGFVAGEIERQQTLDRIAVLKGKQTDRELALKSDISGVKVYIDEKAEVEKGLYDAKYQVTETASEIDGKSVLVTAAETLLETAQTELVVLRTKYNETDSVATDPYINNCYACGQALPPEKLQKVEAERQTKKSELVKQGMDKAGEVQLITGNIDMLNSSIESLQNKLTDAATNLATAEAYKATHFVELDKMIAENPTTPPAQDEEWRKITAEIAGITVEESVSEKLKEIEARCQVKKDELDVLDKSLAQKDNIVKATARIKELEQEEKDLSQQLMDIEAKLVEIGQYQEKESGFIESAVNGMFKCVKFKLFNRLLNGNIEETCMAMLNGTPYPDISYGEKIAVGIDIVNVLSKHYDISVPLFIDNAEGLTFPIEADSQTIELYAVEKKEPVKDHEETDNAFERRMKEWEKEAGKRAKELVVETV